MKCIVMLWEPSWFVTDVWTLGKIYPCNDDLDYYDNRGYERTLHYSPLSNFLVMNINSSTGGE